MSRRSTLFTILLSFLLSFQLSAQLSCQYSLELYDSFGDGWNGSILTVTINGEATSYTVNFDDNNGDFLIVPLVITSGDEVSLSYVAGAFQNEVTYFLYDADGVEVYSDGPNPTVGADIFNFVGNCPSCPVPPPASISIDDIRAFYADVSWIPSDPDGEYLLEFGEPGFVYGTGTTVVETGAVGRLEPLQENTSYEFYLRAACANGDSSIVLGPYPFTTRWANDVGIVGVDAPTTSCGLSASETVTVTIANFGGSPQSLLPINFSVNGVASGVGQPQDGFFTGVLGTDSLFTFEYDITADLSAFGEYEILAWTELANDSLLTNDTFSIIVTNIPVIADLPYFMNFEEWNGGWSVGEGSVESSWAFGAPEGAVINSAASGENAWVTNLTGNYNISEFSYIVSPCFDFSDLTEDPLFSFSLFFDSESCCDEGWVDVSTDAGQTWTKVGTAGTGVNWYNDEFNQWWDGTGNFTGWVTASNVLAGTAGASDVVIRFVLSTDFSVVREGMGVDDILITPQLDNDLAGTATNHTSTLECGEEEDLVVLTIGNIGINPQNGFEVGYSINGGAPVIETVPETFSLAQGESNSYTFTTPFDSSTPGDYTVTAWTSLATDELLINDTITFSFSSALSTPYAEDFEDVVIPANWVVDPDLFVGIAHNSITNVLYDNLYIGDPSFQATMPNIGPVNATDTLIFDYRFSDFFAGDVGTVLSPGDSLSVLISTDCGENYDVAAVINADNHTSTADFTTFRVPLEDYAGQYVKIQFASVWSAGDYYLDLDNIFIPSCLGTLGLEAETTPTLAGEMSGTIEVTPTTGLGPYTYEWADGDFGNTREGLDAGEYVVTVSDMFGCTEQITIVVDLIDNSSDLADRFGLVQLAPNPTTGQTTLSVQLTETTDAQIQVINLLGQPIWVSQEHKNVSQFDEIIDLTNVPAGVYMIQVRAGDQAKVLKAVKSE